MPITNLATQPIKYKPDIPAFLADMGVQYRETWPWLETGKLGKVQGWKLHLSSTPDAMASLLAQVYPILRQYHVPFRVIQDTFACVLLNRGEFGAEAIGKAITVYADEIADIDGLTTALVEATQGFTGPDILSDIYLGGRVFARYGAFNPVMQYDVSGQPRSCIYAPDGELKEDMCGDATANFTYGSLPFDRKKYALSLSETMPAAKVVGQRYLLMEVVERHACGNTFHAVDVCDTQAMRAKLVRQGRFYTVSDTYGRDIRDRFKHQQKMHLAALGTGLVPKCHAYFEENGSAYLVLEPATGVPLQSALDGIRVRQRWSALDDERKGKVLALLENAILSVMRLHALDIVHRDIQPHALYVADDNEVTFHSLEIAQFTDSTAIPFDTGKPGFSAPEQVNGMSVSFAQDTYSLGALIVTALSGVRPEQLIWQETGQYADIRKLSPGLPASFYDCVLCAINPHPECRPALTELRDEITMARTGLLHTQPGRRRNAAKQRPPRRALYKQAEEALIKGLQAYIGHCVMPDGKHGLADGVAGVCYLVDEIKRHDNSILSALPELGTLCLEQARVLQKYSGVQMPGLHNGGAGIALSLCRMQQSGLLSIQEEERQRFLQQAFGTRAEWPDIAYGAAGQGVAVLALKDMGATSGLEAFADSCAGYLTGCQKENGSWVLPEGVNGLSGNTLPGFAHGVAGMAYFLAEYGYARKQENAIKAALRAVQWLKTASSQYNGRLHWKHSDNNHQVYHGWRHGAAGISILFRSLWRHTQDKVFHTLLDKSLYLPVEGFAIPDLSLEQGMGGLGILLIEAFAATQDERYLRDAEVVAEHILYRSVPTHNGIVWLAEGSCQPTTELMAGMGGVLLFLLYFARAKEKASFPGTIPQGAGA